MDGIGIGMRTGTGETGTREIPAVATSENDETQAGGTEKRTGIGTTGTRGKATRIGMQSMMVRWITSGKHGRIRSLKIRGNHPRNRKVQHAHIHSFDLSTDRYRYDVARGLSQRNHRSLLRRKQSMRKLTQESPRRAKPWRP